MIKGVNKQIVEINYTQNDYIEKAILIINPQKSKLPKDLLNQKADAYMKGLLPSMESTPLKPPKKFQFSLPLLAAILSLILLAASLALAFILLP